MFVLDTISVSISAPHPDLSVHGSEQPANHVGYLDTQIPVSLLAASTAPTLLDIRTEDGGGTIRNGDGRYEDSSTSDIHSREVEATQLEFSPEPLVSPTSNTIQSTSSASVYGNTSQSLLKSAARLCPPIVYRYLMRAVTDAGLGRGCVGFFNIYTT